MKIGIFGGTFNPIHTGHINMMKIIKTKMNLDVVYFVPSYQTPDKFFQIEKISPFHRYQMVKKSLKGLNLKWMKVSDFEYKNKKISYTSQTIEHFVNIFPKDELFWIMGEDRYQSFHKWHNYEYIQEKANIIVYKRSLKVNEKLLNDESIIYIDEIFFDVSSTEILESSMWNLIPEEARIYIEKHKLYLKSIVFNRLKKSRYEHSVAVASHARRLAKEYKYKDIEKAWITGLLHDLFKLMTENELTNYIENKGKEFTHKKIPIPALHGFIVALWLRDEYGWKDKEVFSALSSHTLAKPNPSLLDKIIFVADKISTDRKGNKIGKLRKLAYMDLDETYKKILKKTIKNLEKKGIRPYQDTIDSYENLLNKKYGGKKYGFNLKINNKKNKQ